jgi:hypothetical protein
MSTGSLWTAVSIQKMFCLCRSRRLDLEEAGSESSVQPVGCRFCLVPGNLELSMSRIRRCKVYIHTARTGLRPCEGTITAAIINWCGSLHAWRLSVHGMRCRLKPMEWTTTSEQAAPAPARDKHHKRFTLWRKRKAASNQITYRQTSTGIHWTG